MIARGPRQPGKHPSAASRPAGRTAANGAIAEGGRRQGALPGGWGGRASGLVLEGAGGEVGLDEGLLGVAGHRRVLAVLHRELALALPATSGM